MSKQEELRERLRDIIGMGRDNGGDEYLAVGSRLETVRGGKDVLNDLAELIEQERADERFLCLGDVGGEPIQIRAWASKRRDQLTALQTNKEQS